MTDAAVRVRRGTEADAGTADGAAKTERLGGVDVEVVRLVRGR